MPKQNTSEVKLMQRHTKCDINAMLLYVFQMLKMNDKLVLDDRFEKDFVSKCIYCGCVKEQSGIDISYFLISKISLAVFIHYIKQYYKDDPDKKEENYMEQIFVDILNAFQNGLQADEKKVAKVMILDKKKITFLKKKRYVKDDDELRKFIRPLLKTKEEKISKLQKEPDNLLLLYKIIKDKTSPLKGLEFFYTLYDNNQSGVPQSISSKFTFCTLEYRKTHKLCATKNYTEYFTGHQQNMDYIDFDDEIIKKFYIFVGLEEEWLSRTP